MSAPLSVTLLVTAVVKGHLDPLAKAVTDRPTDILCPLISVAVKSRGHFDHSVQP